MWHQGDVYEATPLAVPIVSTRGGTAPPVAGLQSSGS